MHRQSTAGWALRLHSCRALSSQPHVHNTAVRELSQILPLTNHIPVFRGQSLLPSSAALLPRVLCTFAPLRSFRGINVLALPEIGGAWPLDMPMLLDGQTRGPRPAAGYVRESGEPFYGTRVGPGWYQSGAGVASGCKVPFSVSRMLMQANRHPPPCNPHVAPWLFQDALTPCSVTSPVASRVVRPLASTVLNSSLASLI